MLGDLILFIKRIIKQHITCIHDYKYVNTWKVVNCFDYYECKKCGKIK